ncbi:MAG: acetamidase/formamidase family protein [Treponema sp.]|nr:acetamidase/formamidase family protein [Treponema sp.]
MLYEINDNHINYFFDPAIRPVLAIKPGDSVRFETKDALTNVLEKQSDSLENSNFDKNRVNPVTGPVFVEGAEPGDIIEITINKIEFKHRAVITCQAGYGVIGKYFEKTTHRVTPIKDGKILFDGKLEIPLAPMIGVLGTTPVEKIRSEYIGPHGGNMDNTMMREGASLYLPVFLPGALVATGDVHAAMGDGEINCSAIEAPAFVTLTMNIRKDLKINHPILVDRDNFSIVVSKPTMDEAMKTSIEEMALILRDRLDAPFDDISMLLSAVGNAQICQCVSPLMTARYVMPRYVLDTYGFNF